MGSSAKAGGGSKSYNYFGTLAALICDGPVDELYGIEVDDTLQWSGSLRRETSPNPVTLTVPGYGECIFYWGTDDQLTTPVELLPRVSLPDTVVNGVHYINRTQGNNLDHAHPAYTGSCYAIIRDFLFGQEKTNAPTVRFFVRRRPRQSLVTGQAALLTDGQANPVAVIAELLTSERAGLGWPDGMFDKASWQRAADLAQAFIGLTGVSLVLDKQTAAKSLIIDLLDLCDGYIRANRETGLCEIGVFSPPEQIDASALPLITSDNLTAAPELKPDTWDDVPTRWWCAYRDRDKNFKQRSIKHDDARARYSTGVKRPETLQRDFIVRTDQAAAQLREHARRLGVPGVSGTLTVRSAFFAGVRPGERVRVDIDPEPGGAQLQQVFRVLETTRKSKGELKLKLTSERTLAPVAWTPPPAAPDAPPAPPPAVPDIATARFFECPLGLADNANFAIAALVQRPDGMVTNYRLYYDSDPQDVFPMLGGARSFALRARLAAPVGASLATPATLQIELLDTLSQEIISENPGETAARDDTLLLIALKSDASQGGQIKADAGGKAWLEVFSCVEFIAAGEGLLDVPALRARRGSAAHDFAAGDEVWIIRRDQLSVLTHADFAGLAAGGRSAYFKLQPGEQARARPLEDCAARAFNFALARDLPELVDNARYLETRYRYQSLKPQTPTGDYPNGWSTDRPDTGSGVLWASQAWKREITGALLGVWSAPARVDGARVFYQATMPVPATDDLRAGDQWFNVADDNKLYRYDTPAGGGALQWVPSFAPMLKFADGIVYGLQKTDGTDCDFVMVADRFQIWDGKSAQCPFEIVDGKVYIKDALIGNLSAGKLTSGAIESAEIVLVGAGAVIKTDDYEPGVSGCMISGAGAEFNRVVVRDTIITGTLGNLILTPRFAQFPDTQVVTVSAPEDSIIRYTEDGGDVTPDSQEWPQTAGVYTARVIAKGMLLKARAFGLDGRMTNQDQSILQRSAPQVTPVVISMNSQPGKFGEILKFSSIRLACDLMDATIYWRTKTVGSATQWTVYVRKDSVNNGVSFNGPASVEAYAAKDGMDDSVITSISASQAMPYVVY